MRLTRLSVKNAPPVKLFEVSDLADVIVLAGPNGVGKTRLLRRIIDGLRGGGVNPDLTGEVEATIADESKAWGKSKLDLSSPADVTHFTSSLQSSRLRRNLKSSLVNIESDRTIQNIAPLAYTFDMPDPEEEEIAWDISMGFMRDRYQDTIHSMFRMIEVQKQRIANRAIDLKRQGKNSMQLGFTDPMEPFKEIFRLLLAPKELVDPVAKDQRLFYTFEDQKLEFQSLSSGEREVVNIAFDFLLRKPQDCIVFFDEPELHLHPELSYRLIQTLQRVGLRNQFVLSTHSPDVITASLDKSVIFLSPPSKDDTEEPVNQAIAVSEADETNQALKLLGQSIGIVALGKKIVLIEGEQSSADKQTYGSIISNKWPQLVLVPSGGKHVLESFGIVYERVLSKTIWGVDFFMLCDRDSVPAAAGAAASKAQQSGRLKILNRYHLENYFLDENIWANAFAALETEESWLRSAATIRQALRDEAAHIVSYATALATASHVRFSAGNLDIMPKDCHDKNIDELSVLLADAVTEESKRVIAIVDANSVKAFAKDYYEKLTASLKADDDLWKELIPGKPLLGRFANRAQINASRAKTMYLNAAGDSDTGPFAEIIEIFRTFGE